MSAKEVVVVAVVVVNFQQFAVSRHDALTGHAGTTVIVGGQTAPIEFADGSRCSTAT